MTILQSLTLLSAVSFTLATPLSTSSYGQRYDMHADLGFAPLHVPTTPNSQIINNSYIVMFKEGVHATTFQSHFNFLTEAHASDPLRGSDSGINHVWDSHIQGYSGWFTRDVVDLIRRQPEVNYVEHDQVVHTLSAKTQKSAPWGLARLSHRAKLTLGTFSQYQYNEHGGEGVNAYVIDTGVYVEHVEFEGRAKWGAVMPQGDTETDAHGHGTHCAGTIASRKFGVAKAANIIAVKVLGSNGSGSMSDVVGGVAWAAQDAQKVKAAAEAEFKATGKTKYKGSVSNMSLGGGKSRALDDAVNKAVGTGMHFAVAAGNDNRDACDYSPAGAERAVTVGASTIGDERAYFSNYGKCVDVFAPGLNIRSTWNGYPQDENTISGTSMASPHTAGLIAYFISLYPSKTFSPNVASSIVPPSLDSQFRSPLFPVPYKAYSLVHSYLPGWVKNFLPSFPGSDNTDAEFVPLPILTPVQLKEALIALSTKDALVASTMPAGTKNILIFNNATDTKGHTW